MVTNRFSTALGALATLLLPILGMIRDRRAAAVPPQLHATK